MGASKRGLFLPRQQVPLFDEVIVKRGPGVQSVDQAIKTMLPWAPRVVREQILRLCKADPSESVISLPLVVGDQAIGMFSLWGEDVGEEDVSTCALFASQLSSAMEKASLLDETRRRASYLEAITRVAATLRSAETPGEMFSMVLEQLEDILETEGACVARLDPTTNTVVFVEARRRWQELKGLEIRSDQGICGRVIGSGEAFVRDDISRNSVELESDLLQRVRAIACAPLNVQQQPIGCLMVGRDSALAPEDLRVLMATADMVANAMQRAEVVETLELRVAERTRELEQANIRLQELDALKSEFVTNVSHELRTPITNILLYLDLIDQPLEAGKRASYAAILKREAERLGRLIEDLLTLSRNRAGSAADQP